MGRVAAHFEAELEQPRECSFEFGSKLQIIVGDHAGVSTAFRRATLWDVPEQG